MKEVQFIEFVERFHAVNCKLTAMLLANINMDSLPATVRDEINMCVEIIEQMDKEMKPLDRRLESPCGN